MTSDTRIVHCSELDIGKRLDIFVTEHVSKISRVKIGRLIHSKKILVDQAAVKPSYRIKGLEKVSIEIPPPEPTGSKPENIPISILYEDEHLAVVDKPPAMVVHPAKGNWSGTLTAALTFHFENLSNVGGETRPGIVHRLDRDTSGAIIVAKTDQAHMHLTRQFEKRTVEKTYFAIVSPAPARDRDWIREPIGPHPYQREKMAIRLEHPSARTAQTFYEVAERFQGLAVVHVKPKTGRTHQIRVHLAHLGCPVFCDKMYSGRSRFSASQDARETDNSFVLNRQALHAWKIKFQHPATNEFVEFEAPVPADLIGMLNFLKSDRAL